MTRREMGHASMLGLGALACHATAWGASPPGRLDSKPANPQVSGSGINRESNGPNGKGLTRYIAEFIVNTTYPQIPDEVVEMGKKSILDGFGLALAGSRAGSGKVTRTYLESLELCHPEATVAGSAMKVPARFAAYANGIGIHADDYDDTQLAATPDRVYGLLTHPTASVLPAALAAAEAAGASGRDLTLAYHLGVEVECKIADAISPRHYEDGFHSTGTCGVFGAAAAAAKLRKLELGPALCALGIAGSEAAGMRINFGTMTKPFHAGRAAEGGIVAADLAALGWTATDEILEAPTGFFRAAGGGYNLGAILHKLGKPWTFASPGVSIKPFPSGSLTHPGMTELLRLIRDNKITAGQVERLDVGTNPYMPSALIYHHPEIGLQGKFSMEYCMALALLYGKATLGDFTNQAVLRPQVQAMVKKVHFYVSPELEKAGYNKMTTIVDIHLRDGRTISGRADFAKGSPANPMSFDEVVAKFRDNAAYARWPATKTQGVIDAVRKLEEVPDVRTLAALCAD